MAKKDNFEKGIKLVCHGQYYFKTEKERGVKLFSQEVFAPSLEMFREHAQKYTGVDDKGNPKFEDRSFINVRGQLKKRLMPALLRKKFQDFARVRFVVIDEIISLDGSELDLPITFRSKRQLAAMIQKEGLPLNVSDYIDIDDLRSDIVEYIHDPKSFLEQKPKKDKLRIEERDFLRMNGLDDEALSKKKESSGVAGVVASGSDTVSPAAPVKGVLDL